MDDREAKSYSTPPEAASSPAEADAAAQRMAKGLPALFASVFTAFVIVAVVFLLIRYVF